MSQELIEYLKQLIELQSVSADISKKAESLKTAEFISSKLLELGAETKIVPNAITGKNPLLFGKLGSDPAKKTILFYSHYDVQPALKEDGWDTEPFIVIEKEGYLYGRGVTDDKGPIAVVYQAVKELQKKSGKNELPVNIFF